jgi:two-component sensor histidine kinase
LHHDQIRRLTERVPPRSWQAFAIAIGFVALATMARLAWSGASLPFATYFPAVLVTALLAGPVAGLLAIALSVLLAWWAFIGPAYGFTPLTAGDFANICLFVLSSALIVWLADSYRNALHQLHANDRNNALMMRELEHRGKNTSAIVEAIVRMTLQNHPKLADDIVGRVRAVSSTNDLVNQSGASKTTLEAILRKEFEPYGARRLVCDGGNVEVDAETARSLALVVHEMVTNAVKHGALANEAGQVTAAWSRDGKSVRLEWKETGGPPVVAPDAYGFGSRLITRSLKTLSGNIVAEFPPEGLRCTITFAMP